MRRLREPPAGMQQPERPFVAAGDGGWAFGRARSARTSVDITPLVVVTNALWALGEAVEPAQFFVSWR